MRRIPHQHRFQLGSGPSFCPGGAAGLEVLGADLEELAAGHRAGSVSPRELLLLHLLSSAGYSSHFGVFSFPEGSLSPFILSVLASGLLLVFLLELRLLKTANFSPLFLAVALQVENMYLSARFTFHKTKLVFISESGLKNPRQTSSHTRMCLICS